jgi:coenzyme F420-reducing hydrogenase alpha subunit
MKIKIDHIAKIEGHAGFTAEIIDGHVSQARLNVLEGARLLEGILRSRKYYEVSAITARICGVCPVVHTLTSLKALENAMNVRVSRQTIFLRKLLMLGQLINSHALHIFFFSLSDFFGIKNDLELIAKYPEKTKSAVAIRNFGNKIIEIIGGRSIHPITPIVGGFTKLPSIQNIKKIGKMAKEILPQAVELAQLFASLAYPDFERKTDFVCLFSQKDYAIYDKEITINRDSYEPNIESFMHRVKEFQVQEDAVKRTSLNENPYMVGAIARINNNSEALNPKAKKIFKKTNISLPSLNPFHNILAQAVEIVHCVEEIIALTKAQKIIRPEEQPISRSAISPGFGSAAIEAPRGSLFYFYEVGADGLIKNCNIITPTAQNLARLEEDLKIWLPLLEKQGLKEDEIKDKIRMLIRAYDPCLTCATH